VGQCWAATGSARAMAMAPARRASLNQESSQVMILTVAILSRMSNLASEPPLWRLRYDGMDRSGEASAANVGEDV
jgi:hypothetical protein